MFVKLHPIIHSFSMMPSNYLILCSLLLLLPSIFPSIRLFSQWLSSCHQVAKVLQLQLQHQFFRWIFRVDFLQDWLVWSPCCPRDSQESSPTLQFESINLALSLLYGPDLTSVHDYYYYYHILARANTGTLLGNRIFADIIKFQTRPTWTKVDPNSVWLMSLFTYFSF